MRINQIMTSNPIVANPEMTVQELTDLMTSKNIHHIPVVDDDGHLIGIVSDRDISHHISHHPVTTELYAKDIMSSSPITITADSRIETASILLLENNFSCLPVMEDRKDTLIGIVTWKDILSYYIYT